MAKDNKHHEESAVRDRDAGRYDPPKDWSLGREPLGSPERNAYENINPRHPPDKD